MRVFGFLGMSSVRLEDGQHQTAVRCSCLAKANVRVTVKAHRVTDARCPVCNREFDVMVEQGEPWPVDPRQVISAE
jgi:hypothetical protein